MPHRFPEKVPCPVCPGSGVAVGVTAAKDKIEVHMRCEACGHQWSVLRDDPDTPPRTSAA